jgi:hypothetical protein
MFFRKNLMMGAVLLCSAMCAARGVAAQESKMKLFKVITVQDEIVIGLSEAELKAIGGTDAGAVAHAIAQKGDLAVWRYNVRRGKDGQLEQGPTAKIGLLANSSLRVEPYTTPYAVVPHE